MSPTQRSATQESESDRHALSHDRFCLARVLAAEYRELRPGAALPPLECRPDAASAGHNGVTDADGGDGTHMTTPSRDGRTPAGDEEPARGADRHALHGLFEVVHGVRTGEPLKLSALCLSGGGIRSATFNLGVLQGLARRGVLPHFDYLSTVSGGGYIGSWLSAWISRSGDDPERVAVALAGSARAEAEPAADTEECEPEQVRHLRRYSNYLSPRPGLLSADTWTLVAMYLRNLVLNWLVFVPLLLAAVALPRLYLEVLRSEPGRWGPVPASAWPALLLLCGILSGAWAIAYIALQRPSRRTPARTSRPEPHGDNQAHVLRRCLLPIMGTTTCFVAARAWLLNQGCDVTGWGGFLVCLLVALVTVGLGWAAHRVGLRRRWRGWSEPRELASAAVTAAAIAAIAWPIGRRLYSVAPADAPYERVAALTIFAVPAALALAVLASTVFMGLAAHWTDDQDREWWSRTCAWLLIVVVVWTVLGGLVLFGPVLLLSAGSWGRTLLLSLGGGSGALAATAGASAATPAMGDQSAPGRGVRIPHVSLPGGAVGALLRALVTMLVPLAIVAFLVFLVVALSLLSVLLAAPVDHLLTALANRVTWLPWSRDDMAGMRPPTYGSLIYEDFVGKSRMWLTLLGAVVLAGVGVLASRFVDVNEFSLHAMYRNRLIRCYLGASNMRRPDRFTDFDERDDIRVRHLRALPLPTEGRRLFHVVNMTLNLVSGGNLAWQQRRAESFTVSPLHAGSSGNPEVGYRATAVYGGHDKRTVTGDPGTVDDGGCLPGDGLSLGTALAISGAAASPNMGYHSSTLLTLIMTLFNARLGWWLGNPRSEKGYARSGPASSARTLVAEAFGKTTDRHDYINLSDGGHFENLGVYEMVLRRCHLIVVGDATDDAGFQNESLANAIRKVRVDLGIPIELAAGSPSARVERGGGHAFLYRVRYSSVDRGLHPDGDGWLIQLKTGICGTEPVDVLHHAAAFPPFPHTNTADQMFDEAQFESYRALGLHVVEQLYAEGGDGQPVTGDSATVIASFQKHVERVVLGYDQRRDESVVMGASPEWSVATAGV